MIPVYFAHGYRKNETQFVSYFAKLMGKIGFIPSIDPPSNDVNAAKLERHLSFTEGIIAVLVARKEGPSLHILFEISMAMRARKPCLVFVENTLPDKILPPEVFQYRFSSRSYVRDSSNHLHILERFKSYIGEYQLPHYRMTSKQRYCVLTGTNELSRELKHALIELIHEREYKIFNISTKNSTLPLPGNIHYDISDADLSISVVNSQSILSNYTLGIIQSMLVPNILFATSDYPLNPGIPEEYQRKIISNESINKSLKIIDRQIELYEEDFIEIDNDGKAEEYANQLTKVSLNTGFYSQEIRTLIIQELNNYENISNSTIVNKSFLSKALNNLSSENKNEVSNSLVEISKHIELTGNAELAELFNGFNQELNNEKSNKTILRTLWDGVVNKLPDDTNIATAVATISEIFS